LKTTIKRYIVAIGLILIVISGGTCDDSKKGAFMKNYVNILAATDPQKIETLRQGPEGEKKAIEKFYEFYKVFSGDVIRKSIKDDGQRRTWDVRSSCSLGHRTWNSSYCVQTGSTVL
jgi:hypothetical protein